MKGNFKMDKRDAYLWLYGVVGCNNLTIDKIEREMPGTKDIFDFSEKTIYNLERVNDKVKSSIINYKNNMNVDDYKELLYKKNVKYSVIGDDDYPYKLANIYDAPKVLFYKGNLSALGKHFSIGIVGSRKPTVYGAECTKKLARELSDYGADIISGLAIGVDAISHEASLLGKGKTFGVLGSGIDNPLPKTNIWLMNKIVDSGGAVISEHGINKKVHPHYFANRNRIISGLSDGVIIVEAAKKSGALITAEFAAEQGRSVFAVPGSIFSENSKGCHRLIKEGAKLTENIDDVLEEFEVFKFKTLEKEIKYDTIEKADINADLEDDENILVDIIRKNGSIDMDSLCLKTKFGIEKINPIVEKLKLYDLIFEIEKGVYSMKI
ncbi:DNA protecting protein DprA [Peptacetobacter hiranonis DSM 13275]|uniref:DNA protecting protein DprA n=2 Tax=Peptostreptococcaceae TaxID=186804 RepID=B6FZ86_PEPHT|nr:DNA protecting protein DprA [Peptacetobacter hiranonis DSM 13275]